MDRVVVIGADGQLGADLVPLLRPRYEVVGVTIFDLDICDHPAVRSFLTAHRPQLVINTAAFHAVDACEDRIERTFAVNVVAVHHLATVCRELDARLMQFSTDFVFHGEAGRTRPFTESDCPNPRSVYAISRLAGEQMVRSACPKHYLIRTCGLYGAAGQRDEAPNFVEIMLRLARAGKTIRVVDDQTVAPTATADLSARLVELLATGRFGLYHVTNRGQCTWYEFARAIFELAGLQPTVVPVTTSAYGAKAARPGFSVLDDQALRAAGLASLRPWREALTDYLRARDASSEVPS